MGSHTAPRPLPAQPKKYETSIAGDVCKNCRRIMLASPPGPFLNRIPPPPPGPGFSTLEIPLPNATLGTRSPQEWTLLHRQKRSRVRDSRRPHRVSWEFHAAGPSALRGEWTARQQYVRPHILRVVAHPA